MSTINNQLAVARKAETQGNGPKVEHGSVVMRQSQNFSNVRPLASQHCSTFPQISLLTASRDRPYALGMAAVLIAEGLTFDFVGGDVVDSPDLHGQPRLNYFHLRNQRNEAGSLNKITRVLVYYFRLIRYAAMARPKVFHILWNNKFEWFDRTLLMIYYRLLGRKIAFTAHNVNIRARDGRDSCFNRATLKFQYRQCDRIFVHTEKMKTELMAQFGIPNEKVCVIPFGINNTVPDTELTTAQARHKLGVPDGDKVLLFFGNIAPYKGLEYLVKAFIALNQPDHQPAAYRLIIAGRPKGSEDYWNGIDKMISSSGLAERIHQRIEFITDEQTELYFKAADVLVLPYTHIFQSGVLFLGYSFGLPVIASDVGTLKEEIIEGKTGFICRPKDPDDLAGKIEQYFTSDMYRDPARQRQSIREYANERYSWSKAGKIIKKVYEELLGAR
jgi:glycosyltransferase involved in cell wall biosynthesis